jgi:hypothetical protein
MAHFAEIGLNNTVLRVIVVSNDDCKDQHGNESEMIGAKFCHDLFGGVWLQTSYNGNMRKNYAGIGYIYDSQRDAFVAPKPFASWLFDEETCRWNSPVPYPTDNNSYYWNESILNWSQNEP